MAPSSAAATQHSYFDRRLDSHRSIWHTVNDTVIAYGETLVNDPSRYGIVSALGLDEVLFARIGRYRKQHFSTQFVDVTCGQLLDIVPGRGGKEPKAWIEKKDKAFRDGVRFATLDLSGPYRGVLDEKLPAATQVADLFHVVRWANTKLDECRRRVQDETMGHRGHKDDPLFRCRRLQHRHGPDVAPDRRAVASSPASRSR